MMRQCTASSAERAGRQAGRRLCWELLVLDGGSTDGQAAVLEDCMGESELPGGLLQRQV
jgi:hypothetical protein